ncbi:hypothetical protein ACSBR1_036500 [Camellia fascicularis]
MTNSFRVKLGQGGYGCVFKGKLENGCLMAVKVLNGLKDNKEEFINEVAAISRTSYVNIVNLLGFCFDRHNRALLFEFMPNGSHEKFIHDENSLTYHQFGWEALYKITGGIARRLKNFGGVPHKLDVYSYGMMILEMVGGRKNIDVKVDHTSEIYFPYWIYKRLELDEELGVHGIMNDEANESARKMIIVVLSLIHNMSSHDNDDEDRKEGSKASWYVLMERLMEASLCVDYMFDEWSE